MKRDSHSMTVPHILARTYPRKRSDDACLCFDAFRALGPCRLSYHAHPCEPRRRGSILWEVKMRLRISCSSRRYCTLRVCQLFMAMLRHHLLLCYRKVCVAMRSSYSVQVTSGKQHPANVYIMIDRWRGREFRQWALCCNCPSATTAYSGGAPQQPSRSLWGMGN